MTPEIAPLAAGLALPLSAMHRACFPEEPWDAEALGRILGLAGVFGWLASDAGGPAGFLVARDLGEEAEILTIGVLPECRRRGIGGALIAAMLSEAARRGLASAVLEVAADNRPARLLYAAAGFRQVGRRRRYYRRGAGSADALILRRAVASEAAPG